MKTANLTPWCNLFSTASKYNIGVKKSRYKVLLYTGSAVAFILLSLTFFTYAYHLALAIAVIGLVILGLLLPNKSAQAVICSNVNVLNIAVSSFELNSQGICSFDGNNYYQLQASSRFSFLGCWLVLQQLTAQPLTAQPITTVNSMFNAKSSINKSNNTKTRVFIYRDSLSNQDFSRLSTVISQLNHQC